MVFKTWDLNFGAWEILGYGFQNMVFRTWDLNFGAWEITGYGFQDLGSQLWGLGNYRIWFSRLGISTLGPGKF
jgi:hypothetical protein